jgi:hypothetical protein
VALAEKAYAQINESGWSGQDGTNSYQGIEIGHTSVALKHVTAKQTTYQAIYCLIMSAIVILERMLALIISFNTRTF